jgi:SAM-dependent methyltransferase
MAEFARASGVDVEVATFETWEPAGRTFDAIVSGTAWHWVDPVAGAAKAAEVLRPGGVLAPFGHVCELPPPVAAALAEALRRTAPEPAPPAVRLHPRRLSRPLRSRRRGNPRVRLLRRTRSC